MKKLITSLLLVLCMVIPSFAGDYYGVDLPGKLGIRGSVGNIPGYFGRDVFSTAMDVAASGSIAANLAQLDLTATNAFAGMSGVDLSAYQDGNHILQIINTATGYSAFGYISDTAPGGETLSANLITGWGNSAVNVYETLVAVGANITAAINLVGTQGVAGTNLLEAAGTGKLFQLATTLTLNSGTAPFWSLTTEAEGAGGMYDATTLLAAGANTRYTTRAAAATYSTLYNNNTATNFAMASTTIKQVTDCAVTGALIVSTKGGAVRTFAYKHASFDGNAASTYKVFYMGD